MWLFLLGTAFAGSSALAQSELTRVSIAERSDGEGFVLRFHLTEAPDSFQIARPSPQLVQLNIYGSELGTGETPAGENDDITDIQLFDLENGAGADIYLNENSFFATDAYPDVNGRDLLLSLEYTSEEEVLSSVTDGFRINRGQTDDAERDDLVQDNRTEIEETESAEENIAPNRDITRAGAAEKRVTYGVLAGFTVADVKGDAFVSEPRSGISFGLAVGVKLPWRLPYDIRTGIETGIIYTQKGFENATPDFLNAEIVEFDYIEVPVLAKLSYPLLEQVSPYFLIGPSLGFNVSAERVRTDESRADLDDQTRSADLSLIIGGGIDVSVGSQILSLQAKGGLSFSDVFKTVDESPGTDFFKHRIVALELVFRL
jgi:hypothetical protein